MAKDVMINGYVEADRRGQSKTLLMCTAILSALSAACDARTSSAPAAPVTGNVGVIGEVRPTTSTDAAQSTALDAGSSGAAIPDGGARAGSSACSVGQRSVPYSATDPCAQGITACVQSGWVAITTCRPDGTWDAMSCTCLPLDAGSRGAPGSGSAGSTP